MPMLKNIFPGATFRFQRGFRTYVLEQGGKSYRMIDGTHRRYPTGAGRSWVTVLVGARPFSKLRIGQRFYIKHLLYSDDTSICVKTSENQYAILENGTPSKKWVWRARPNDETSEWKLCRRKRHRVPSSYKKSLSTQNSIL